MSSLDGTLTVPLHALGEREIAGLRVSMLTIGDDDAPIAGVDSGGGMGSAAIWLYYDDGASTSRAYAYVDGRELLAAWLKRRPEDPRARGVLNALGVADAPPTEGPGSEFFQAQRTEHEAWTAVVSALRGAGITAINAGGRDEKLHDLLVAWGEELAELRRLDPDPEHGARALAERRAKIDQWNEADS